jgi:hypothetical protein
LKYVRHALGPALAWIALGCGGLIGGPTAERAAADAGAPEPVVPDGAANRAEDGPSDETDAGAAEDDGGALSDLTGQTTVWIGEVESTATYPEDLYTTEPQKVVLVLGPIAGSVIVGTVTFGSSPAPPPPVDPAQPYPPSPGVIVVDAESIGVDPSNWSNSPYSGFAYSLVSSTLQGNNLALAFEPSEVWREWCAIQPGPPTNDPGFVLPVCTCGGPLVVNGVMFVGPMDGSSCQLTIDGSSRHLDLAISGGEMQGQLGPGYQESPALAVRLQRVQ